MKPLQSIAMGFVIIALYARLGGFDLLADPVGWLLVLAGVSRLGPPVTRTVLLYVGVLALVVAVPLMVPAVVDALAREDESLAWAADLPGFAFTALLFQQLAGAATEAGDRTASRVCGLLVTLTLVVAALPVLVFGAGWSEVADTASTVAELLRLATVVALFVYAGRNWATPRIVESPADLPDSS